LNSLIRFNGLAERGRKINLGIGREVGETLEYILKRDEDDR